MCNWQGYPRSKLVYYNDEEEGSKWTTSSDVRWMGKLDVGWPLRLIMALASWNKSFTFTI